MLTFTMPIPPSVNALYRNVSGKGRVRTKAYDAWREEAGWYVRTKWRAVGAPVIKPQPMALSIRIGLDDRRSDLSNRIKAIEDILVACCDGLPDDRWNDAITVVRDASIAGKCVVAIAPLTPN